MKKILYITNVRLPTEKAHGLQIMKSCEAFVRQGVSVTLLAPQIPTFDTDPFEYYGVAKNFKIHKVFTIPVQNYYVRGLSFTFSALVYALWRGLFKDSIVYSRDVITLFVTSLFGLRPVAELHDYRSAQPQWQYGFFLRRASAIIVNSEGTKSLLLKHYAISRPILVAPNGVDVNFFDIPQTKAEARTELGLSQDKPMIGYVGSLETVGQDKGVGTLREAYAMLDPGLEAELHIIGRPDHFVPYGKVPLYLRAFDVMVIPLPHNQHATTTSPIKLFEYMAAGKPMIVSNLPVFREYLDDTSALFFESGNSKDLAAKITLLIKDVASREKISQEVQRRAQTYTWEGRAQKILEFIFHAH